jgi:hypothetical protein
MCGEAFLVLVMNEVHRGCAAVAHAENIGMLS